MCGITEKETTMELTDNMKEWFRNLLDEEIEQAKGAARNERVWACGSDDETTSAMHAMNSIENETYVEFLESLKEKYLG